MEPMRVLNFETASRAIKTDTLHKVPLHDSYIGILLAPKEATFSAGPRRKDEITSADLLQPSQVMHE